MKGQVIIGKIIYSIIFLLVVPAGLWFWSIAVEGIVSLPPVHSQMAGISFSSIGMLLILWGMWALKYHGKGLPMNAFPPEQYVTRGPYKIVKHPIYVGFAILMVGVSVWTGSASLLWLVTPVTILGMIALVLGHEAPDLEERFNSVRFESFFDLPKDDDEKPAIHKRISMLVLVMMGIMLCNFLIGHLGVESYGIARAGWINTRYPDVTAIVLIAIIVLVPLTEQRQSALRAWTIASLSAVFILVFMLLFYPDLTAVVTPANPKIAVFAIPNAVFLVISVVIMFKRSGDFRWLYLVLAVTLLGIFIPKPESIVLAIVFTLISSVLVLMLRRIWLALVKASEKLANSWHEWDFGSVRIINHGIYVGVGAFLGSFLIAIMTGANYIWGIVIFALIIEIFSALWAQLIEGSEKLKRPFGYYGAIVGILFAGIIVWMMGYDVWAIIGATSVVMAWVQGVGRMRCLINGCCHGKPVENPDLGIRYTHPRSRVTHLSNMAGVPLHPTQLYSIAWLFVIGFVLLAIWQSGAPHSFTFGMYLVLTGLGRFVEEAYRGEVQTPILYKLRLYQWTAVASIIIGAVFSCIPVSRGVLIPGDLTSILLGALAIGFFTFFAMGVDFPKSNARFSRLV